MSELSGRNMKWPAVTKTTQQKNDNETFVDFMNWLLNTQLSG